MQEYSRHTWFKKELFWTVLVILVSVVLLFWGTPAPAATNPENLQLSPASTQDMVEPIADPSVAHLVPWMKELEEKLTKTRSLITKFSENFTSQPIKELTEKEERFLSNLSEWYGLNRNVFLEVTFSPAEKLAELNKLIERVDIWPRAFILAQAQIETQSGEFIQSKEAHNYFGLTCQSKGCGVAIPGVTSMELKRFSSDKTALESYYHRLNRHEAYESLRKARSKMRAENKLLDDMVLAEYFIAPNPSGLAHLFQLKAAIRSQLPVVGPAQKKAPSTESSESESKASSPTTSS